jgi:adenylate kinase family enzyme
VGKGTYGRILSTAMRVPHVASGDLVRAWLAGPTAARDPRQSQIQSALASGKRCRDGSAARTNPLLAASAGQLCPTDVVTGLLKTRLADSDGSAVLLDG